MADKVAIIVVEVDMEANHSYILTPESMEKEEIYLGRPGHWTQMEMEGVGQLGESTVGSIQIKFVPVQTVPSFSLALIPFSSAAAANQFWKMLAIYNHCRKLLWRQWLYIANMQSQQ